ncbi:hypothetical protein ATCV1_z579R [Acanthocystis turfacea chlorella virus 1]|uniref:Uncharacterized protein z579R n=1 Tax=Chlorovirus heliozoae TaxID=322019 RepID=A7K9I9_9PHYC|nr:hypothetical protein ATCV1_z579R [Acanthocystis turfacea chlorella virus 1]ABT16713.1 hypothetical protein ATCV1_z579R [Acanthocystis turfacea chlorella virus 1]
MLVSSRLPFGSCANRIHCRSVCPNVICEDESLPCCRLRGGQSRQSSYSSIFRDETPRTRGRDTSMFFL